MICNLCCFASALYELSFYCNVAFAKVMICCTSAVGRLFWTPIATVRAVLCKASCLSSVYFVIYASDRVLSTILFRDVLLAPAI